MSRGTWTARFRIDESLWNQFGKVVGDRSAWLRERISAAVSDEGVATPPAPRDRNADRQGYEILEDSANELRVFLARFPEMKPDPEHDSSRLDPNFWTGVIAQRLESIHLLLGQADKMVAARLPEPKLRHRARGWNGKTTTGRLRDLQRARREKEQKGGYAELVALSTRISQLCAALEDFTWHDFRARKNADEGEDWKEGLIEVYADLISLGEWYDRALSQVSMQVGPHAKLYSQIKKLRAKADSTTYPAEAESARRRADQLERLLEARLESGAKVSRGV
jgi:hypothetical protein